ncbi:MAG: MATE family efflux transporter [Lentisphaeria bacterium]|nr:MATE family efflux transporter [Lentisphaeria bacterium]
MRESSTYLRGSIARVMLTTALSMVPGTLAISGYNLVDTYFVSRLGTDPLAAMGFTFPVVMIVGCIYHGLGGGVMTPVAQLLGAGRREQAARMVTSGIVLFTLLGAAISAAGIVFIDPVFRQLGAKADLMPMIREYMVIWFLGSLSVALGGAGTHLLVSAGSPRLGGAMMMFGLVLNAVLDPLFIFGWGPFPGRGIAGAAVATIIAQFVALALVTLILHFKLRLIAPLSGLFPYPRVLNAWRTIFRYGIPAILGMILNPAGMAVVTRAVEATGGKAGVAAASAAGRLEAVAFIFPMSLGMSLLPIIGQNFGAKQYDRIDTCRKLSMRFAFGFLAVMSVVYYFFAPEFAAIFSRDPAVLSIMVKCLRITAWGFAFIEIHRYSSFYFTGVGRAKSGAALNILRVVGLMVPLTLVAALGFRSLDGVFCARLAADVLAGAIGSVLAARLTGRLMRAGAKG